MQTRQSYRIALLLLLQAAREGNCGACALVYIVGRNRAPTESESRGSGRKRMVAHTLTLSPPDEARFNELMQGSYRKVFNMAYRLVGNRPDAEDLTQEAFYRAYRSFGDYEGDRPFENWIFRIVTRLFLDLLRNRRRRVKAVSYDTPLVSAGGEDNLYFDMADNSPNPEQEMMSDTFSEELQKALDTLTAEQRLLVTLADVEGMPY